MRKLLNQLIQLQELYFALDEHRVSGDGDKLSALEQDIRLLMDQLPPDKAEFFKKLQQRDPPAIAPVIDGTCYGCGIDLPIYLPSEIMHYDDIYQCPSCSRFLYPYSGEKLDFSQAQAHNQLPRLGIDKFSSERLMMPALASSSGRDIIHEMAQQIADELFFPHPELLTEKALEREVIMSTAVDHGLAFPHVRGVDGSSLTLAVGLKKPGIKFGAPRGRLTRIFFFAVIPVAASAFYLKLLAGLVETFREKTARDALLECDDQKALWKTLKRFTRKHLP